MNYMEKGSLFFQGFHSPPTEDWLSVIEKELGDTLELGSLNSVIDAGLVLKPFYRQEDIALAYRDASTRKDDWLIADRIDIGDSPDGLEFLEDIELIELCGISAGSLSKTLPHAVAANVPVFISGGAELMGLSESNLEDLPGSVSVLIDPFNETLKETERAEIYDWAYQVLQQNTVNKSPLAIGSVNSNSAIQNGAGISTSIAVLLAGVSEWCLELGSRGLECEPVASQLTVQQSIGNQFYTEIAGLRALRILLPQVVDAYADSSSSDTCPHIHVTVQSQLARTSDPYQAFIPGTTGAIAAVFGEPDSICILSPPLPLESGGSMESRRLARNILLLLRHEAYLSSVRDPLSGSYYIEKLTDLLAERAWELFVQIEERGGLSSALKNNLIATWIKTDRAASASRNTGPART